VQIVDEAASTRRGQQTVRMTNQIIAVVFWVTGIGMLCYQSSPFWGAAFFVPFVFGPMFVTHVAVWWAKATTSQFILTLALVSYFAWFLYVYVDVFCIHLDPQSAIALLFVGVYSLPVMLVLWLLTFVMEMKSRRFLRNIADPL
jgi:hypothetical protein